MKEEDSQGCGQVVNEADEILETTVQIPTETKKDTR